MAADERQTFTAAFASCNRLLFVLGDRKSAPGALKTVTVLGTSSTAAKMNARREGPTAMPKAPPWVASMLDPTTNLPLFVNSTIPLG